jgi:putative Holliday junction resolvase
VSEDAGRVLAVDLGLVRIGLALSDPLRITAQPIGHVPRAGGRRDAIGIATLARERDASRIVVGHPLLLSGERGARARDAETFAEELRLAAPGVPVDLWDERFTTAEVERAMIADGVSRRRRRQVADSLAAVLILQGYLDARPRSRGES